MYATVRILGEIEGDGVRGGLLSRLFVVIVLLKGSLVGNVAADVVALVGTAFRIALVDGVWLVDINRWHDRWVDR